MPAKSTTRTTPKKTAPARPAAKAKKPATPCSIARESPPVYSTVVQSEPIVAPRTAKNNPAPAKVLKDFQERMATIRPQDYIVVPLRAIQPGDFLWGLYLPGSTVTDFAGNPIRELLQLNERELTFNDLNAALSFAASLNRIVGRESTEPYETFQEKFLRAYLEWHPEYEYKKPLFFRR